LNSLISIWISSVKVGIPAARRIPTWFLHWKLYFCHKLWWFFLRSYSQSYQDSRHCQFLNQIRRPFLINQITARFCSLNNFISFRLPHQSCSPRRVDKFGLLIRLILISKAQDIPVWVSSMKAGIPAAIRIFCPSSRDWFEGFFFTKDWIEKC